MKRATQILALVMAGLLVGCTDEFAPPTTGSIALLIQSASDTTTVARLHAVAPNDGARAGAPRSGIELPRFGVAGFTAARARAEGPTNKTVNLTLNAGYWEGRLDGLSPGSYAVVVEGLIDDEISQLGRTTGVTVVAGQESQAAVPLQVFTPTLTGLPASTVALRFIATVGTVANATGYRVEVATNPEFAAATSQNVSGGPVEISVPGLGTYYLRARALSGSTLGTPTAPQTVNVVADQLATGETAAAALLLGFGTAAGGTKTQLNIAPAADQDWFAVGGCEGDTLAVETRAARLTPASGLNTRLRIYDSAGVSLIAENDDGTGIAPDSRAQAVLPASARATVQVTGVGGTVGQYEIVVEFKPGPSNHTTYCSPAPATVVVTQDTTLTWIAQEAQLTAVARDAGGQVIPSAVFQWTSSDGSIVTVNATSGLVTAKANGTATITATVISTTSAAEEGADIPLAPAGNSGTATVIVAQVATQVEVTPASATLHAIYDTLTLTAVARDFGGTPVPGVSFGWGSTNTPVATVSAGQVRAVGAGTAGIYARVSGSVVDTATILVDPAFTGTFSRTNGGFADTLVVKPGPGITWTGGEQVRVAGLVPWYVVRSVDSLVILLPAAPVGTVTVEIRDQGALRMIQYRTFTMRSTFVAVTDPALAPDISGWSFPAETFISLSDAAANHFLRISPAATTGMVTEMQWQVSGDLDIYWTDSGGRFVGNFDGATTTENPERTGEAVPALGEWRIRFSKKPGTDPIMARVLIDKTSLGASPAAGGSHSCAIAVDGRAVCWGRNVEGQVGDGTNQYRGTPTPVAGSLRFTAVVTGLYHSCGLTEDGSAYCWGGNFASQLGSSSPGDQNTPVQVQGSHQFIRLVAGGYHNCGITPANDMYCWGYNYAGQLGNGQNHTNSSVPQLVSGGLKFSAVAAGREHTCGVTTAGGGYCWGWGSSGALGNGNTADATTPQQVLGGLTFRSMTAGEQHTCGVTSGSAAYCWGSNTTGQFGTGANDNGSTTPVPGATGLTLLSMDAGTYHTCAVTTGRQLYCWGSNYDGQLGTGTRTSTPTPALIGSSYATVSGGDNHTCAGTTAGDVQCWGLNSTAQVGNAPALPLTPVSIIGIGVGTWTLGKVGQAHSCARNSATNQILCWGANWSGQTGTGSYTDTPVPTAVTGGYAWRVVSSGGSHTCALTTGNAAYCWGSSEYGQLGNGSTGSASASPVAVSGGRTYSMIVAGENHSCAVSSGSAYCWGANDRGQLGNNTTTPSSTPVLVSGGLTYSLIVAGSAHTCGLTTSGAAYCWGDNTAGVLGNGTTTDSPVPVAVTGGLTFRDLTAGNMHTCGHTTSGTAYCWGYGSYGQLGNGSLQYANPVPVQAAPSLTLDAISAGSQHTCGVVAGGGLYCWGNGERGQLGTGNIDGSMTSPVAVNTAVAFTWVSGGYGHTCGVSTTGIYCWGEDVNNQVGDAASTNLVASPVVVAGGFSFRSPGLLLVSPTGAPVPPSQRRR